MAMKVSIGVKLKSGPWGGGNQLVRALAGELSARGADVSFDLADPRLDLILLCEPDPRLSTTAYTHREILNYCFFRNRRALVAHRINNSSEARDDPAQRFNRFRIRANLVAADCTVFVSRWLHDCYKKSGFDRPDYRVILNAADPADWPRKQAVAPGPPYKLVTHHWSVNANKGFDVYERLDAMLAEEPWKNLVAFTYIGRLPEGFAFKNSRHLPPLAGAELSEELRRHDVYLTASRNEAGGNHFIEGGLSGLPLLYAESGGTPEYCEGFGVGFTPENFEERLRRMIAEYPRWAACMPQFPHVASRLGSDYMSLFKNMLDRREEFLGKRRWLERWRLRFFQG